jgi:hypothetical protein
LTGYYNGCITVLQLSRIFSGLTTALITFLEYFAFYSVIIGMAYWQSAKEQSHTTKDELQGRAFDNQNLLSFAILRILIFYLSVRFSVWLSSSLETH